MCLVSTAQWQHGLINSICYCWYNIFGWLELPLQGLINSKMCINVICGIWFVIHRHVIIDGVKRSKILKRIHQQLQAIISRSIINKLVWLVISIYWLFWRSNFRYNIWRAISPLISRLLMCCGLLFLELDDIGYIQRNSSYK